MDQHERADVETAAKIREAQAMQRAFGEHAAKTFLELRNVDPEVTRRVLEHPEQRRQF